MKARKALVRDLRSSIDATCASLLPTGAPSTPRRRASAVPSAPGAWDTLVSDAEAAQGLMREIGDLELDLARLKAAGGAETGSAMGGKRASSRGIPMRGTLTRDEAVQTFDEQVRAPSSPF
jgi:hypothetical protein